MSNPLFNNYLTAPWKLEYIKKNKDPNQCLFCAISQKTPGIETWEVFRDEKIIILLNQYPYNPGHLLILPHDHYENFEVIPSDLVYHMTIMIQRAMKLLKQSHNPKAFNIGLNNGRAAGASINHIHWHIVPRYPSDLNFMEILRTRVLIETLNQTLLKLSENLYLLTDS